MATQVKVPGIGSVDKKYVYAGAAVTAGIVGYAYWRARNAAAEPTTSDYTSGEELATENAYASGSDYAYDGGVSEYAGASGGGNVNVDQNPAPSTNAEWAQRAVESLSAVGVDTLAASAAIGRYIAGLTLTEAQADYIRQARALLGPLPGGDLAIKVAPTQTTPTPNTPGGTPSTTVAKVTGIKTWGNGPSRLTVPLTWNRVPGADYYRVYRKGVAYNIGSSEDNQITIGGLQPNTSYSFTVRAVADNGTLGPVSAAFTAKTKK
jgi:hypothetical protein